MLAIIISFLMSLGVINSPADYHNADIQTQSSFYEWIIESDIIEG